MDSQTDGKEINGQLMDSQTEGKEINGHWSNNSQRYKQCHCSAID